MIEKIKEYLQGLGNLALAIIAFILIIYLVSQSSHMKDINIELGILAMSMARWIVSKIPLDWVIAISELLEGRMQKGISLSYLKRI